MGNLMEARMNADTFISAFIEVNRWLLKRSGTGGAALHFRTIGTYAWLVMARKVTGTLTSGVGELFTSHSVGVERFACASGSSAVSSVIVTIALVAGLPGNDNSVTGSPLNQLTLEQFGPLKLCMHIAEPSAIFA
jgi:hypothetical protein